MATGTVDKLVLQVTAAVDSAAKSLPSMLMAVSKAATAAAGAIAGVTLAAARYADNAAKTADRLGIDVEEYSALAVAADLADVSISGLISSSQSYARQLEAAASGSQRQAEAFARLGIDAKEALASNESFADVLPTIIDRLGEIESPTLRAATAQQVLGRGARDLAPMIRAGSEGLREARRVTEEWGLSMRRDTTNASERLNDSLSLLRYRAQGLVFAFGSQLVPAAGRAVEKFSELLDAMQPRIMHVVERTATALAHALDALVSPAGAAAVAIVALGAAMNVARAGGITGLLAKLPVVGTALSGVAAASWAALAPWIPLALAIGAVVLVIDDLLAFMRGGDSVIGRFAESLGIESELMTALTGLGDLLSGVWDLASALFLGIPDLVARAASALSEFASGDSAIARGLRFLTEQFTFLGVPLGVIKDTLGWMLDNLPSLGGLLESFGRGASALGVGLDRATRIVQGEEGVRTDDASIIEESAQRLRGAEAGRLAGIAAREQAAASKTTNNQTNNVQIRIDGARDPAAVGREVDRAVDRVIRRTAGQVGG